MRQLIYQALTNDDVLRDMLLGDENDPLRVRVYQRGSLGSGDIPAKPKFPFLLIAENPSTVNQEVRQTTNSENRFFLLYCYDEHGTGYLLIEQILRRARDTLLGLVAQVSPSGARCTDVVWQGFSAESRDPEYEAFMRFATFKFTASL